MTMGRNTTRIFIDIHQHGHGIELSDVHNKTQISKKKHFQIYYLYIH